MPGRVCPQAQLDATRIPGLSTLREETTGNSQITIAVLDGPVDGTNPGLIGAAIDQFGLDGRALVEESCRFHHGTEIASIIFGRIAPGCTGCSIPVFECFPAGKAEAEPSDLATAVNLARSLGANVINISAGQQTPGYGTDAELLNAVRDCVTNGVLIVAAAGNDGCNCLHVPAALPGVLSVGAMTADGRPLASSNWGAAYQTSGILAPGQRIPVTTAEGQIAVRTGTSYATAIVSGVVGLLLSRQLKRGQTADPFFIRDALLNTAVGCEQAEADCRRFLAGQLNIPGAISYLDRWSTSMTDETHADVSNHHTVESQSTFVTDGESCRDSVTQVDPSGDNETTHPGDGPWRSDASSIGLEPQACAACRGEGPLVYAMGQLGYDLGSEAGLDAFRQRMAHVLGSKRGEPNPLNEKQLLRFFRKTKKEPWHHEGLTWTLNQSGSPIYAIQPEGPFATRTYRRVLNFFKEQCRFKADRVAVPGVITGQRRLLNGMTVDVINPDLRGLCNWNRQALIDALFRSRATGDQDQSLSKQQEQELNRFLDRIYYELQNLGLRPEHRALNYAGTNLFEVAEILSTLDEKRTLDTIHVERSQICRPGSDCWDIVLSFFDPNQLHSVCKVYRYTVDVSAAIPVTVGTLRSWEARTR